MRPLLGRPAALDTLFELPIGRIGGTHEQRREEGEDGDRSKPSQPRSHTRNTVPARAAVPTVS
jgi:hypothetical protein